MREVERQLIFAGLLIAARLGNTMTIPEKTVSDFMVSRPSDKFGLVNYFKELELEKFCKSPLLKEVNSFNTFLNNDFGPCLCTVIYNTTNLLESSAVNASDVEAAKNKTNNYKYNDPTVYEVWKYVTKISPSLKLLMDHLDNMTKWNIVCHNLDNVLKPYCKFLNVEVILLHNIMQKSKEPLNENIVDTSKKIKEPVAILEEPKESDDLPEIEPPDVKDADYAQKIIDEVKSNDEEPLDITYTKYDVPIIVETPANIQEKDDQSPNKSQIISKSSDDYPNGDDGTINHTETQEAPMTPQKNTFTNHEFGGVEDSHFLFYFGVMTVLSMLFYLALYNKKKIIALLIEGRRSTNHRRRPNTASYSKVETDDGSTVF